MTCAPSCDRCPKPGACCNRFVLEGGSFAHGETYLGALVKAASIHHGVSRRSGNPVRNPRDDDLHVLVGFPFLPLYRRTNGVWAWWCPNLGRDGRCTDYENRPGLCRAYQAGDDPLCVMHVPECDVMSKELTA